MQFAITITETDDLLRASTMLASLHALMAGGHSVAPQVAEPATQEEAPAKARRTRASKPDPVEAYNAVATAAGAATIEATPEPAPAPAPEPAQEDPFASFIDATPPADEPAPELDTEQKREALITVLRKNAANITKLKLTREMGWVAQWGPEVVDRVYAEAIALGL